MIFIVGNSRSGTTMLGRMFGNHSQIYTFGELHFFEHQVDANTVLNRSAWEFERRIELLERLFTSSRDGFFSAVKSGRYRTEAQAILENVEADDAVSAYEAFLRYETKQHEKSISCEQTPRYLFFLKEIIDVFPNARIINLVRDPRDVLFSQKNKWRRRFLGARNIPLREAFRAWANYHPYIIAKLWVAAVRTATEFENHPQVVSIRFEDLLQKPEDTVKQLCDICGIKFNQAMLDIPQVGSSSGQDRPEKRGIAKERSGAWSKGGLSPTEVDICQRVAGQEMRSLGYSIKPISASPGKRWAIMGALVIKGGIALFLNLGRTKGLRETIKRRLSK